MSVLEISVKVTVTMNSLEIHPNLREKLDSLRDNKTVPNPKYRIRGKRFERKFVVPVPALFGSRRVKFSQRERQPSEEFIEHLNNIWLEYLIQDVRTTPVDLARTDENLAVRRQYMILCLTNLRGFYTPAGSACRQLIMRDFNHLSARVGAPKLPGRNGAGGLYRKC